MFSKILIANRGEIACRVIRTARELGIATVAVYSDADRDALHVDSADEAIYIGPSPARDSYLMASRILDAAVTTGADAIHPGYGFLSENAAFARACADAAIVFIGPPASAIEAMGSKAAAKRIMEAAGVPLVPGYHGDDQDPMVLRRAADTMGYPVLLKATAGGGGKGMREVGSAAAFDEALTAARREAKASFGDDDMLVEKYLTKPRHVELQVFCDDHGNSVYLAERDCSIQRRHQKVIEEAPAPGMTAELRQRMGEAAVAAARAIDYRGAGTVEFLLDEDGSFYFMEMNTRLQVEHPVTEMITGQDLVHWQLLVASGATLPLAQDQVHIHGHAFEARVYAEDPDKDFLPVTGTLDYLQAPLESRHVRVDTGVRQGDTISVYYDPMIAKLIVWDENRDRALQRLASALADYRIGGTVTNLEFLYNLSTSQPFVEARLDTGFIDKHSELILHRRQQDLSRDLPLAALALLLDKYNRAAAQPPGDPSSPWGLTSGWRMNQPHRHSFTVHCHQADHPVEVEQQGSTYLVRAAGAQVRLAAALRREQLHIERDGHRLRATLARTRGGYTLYHSNSACQFHEVIPETGDADTSGSGGLSAPMNGTVVDLLVAPGTAVAAGDALLVMEAMKMEHTIRAPAAGVVDHYYFQAGDLVDGGAALLAFTAQEG